MKEEYVDELLEVCDSYDEKRDMLISLYERDKIPRVVYDKKIKMIAASQ